MNKFHLQSHPIRNLLWTDPVHLKPILQTLGAGKPVYLSVSRNVSHPGSTAKGFGVFSQDHLLFLFEKSSYGSSDSDKHKAVSVLRDLLIQSGTSVNRRFVEDLVVFQSKNVISHEDQSVKSSLLR